jgi:CspA family cold shock protein
MATIGTVREWRDEHGWGVIDSADTPGGCWTHYSSLAVAGYRTLAVGQAVELEWEAPGQDGYPYRAVRAWPHGHEPVDDVPAQGATDAYQSTLTLDSGPGIP